MGEERTGIHTQALGIDLVVDVNDLGKAGINPVCFPEFYCC